MGGITSRTTSLLLRGWSEDSGLRVRPHLVDEREAGFEVPALVTTVDEVVDIVREWLTWLEQTPKT